MTHTLYITSHSNEGLEKIKNFCVNRTLQFKVLFTQKVYTEIPKNVYTDKLQRNFENICVNRALDSKVLFSQKF